MSMAMKVRMLLAARDISMTELGKRLEPPTTGQNISAKLRRDNFSEKCDSFAGGKKSADKQQNTVVWITGNLTGGMTG